MADSPRMIKSVMWYTCDCPWITKYCDEHHITTAVVPVAILEQFRTPAHEGLLALTDIALELQYQEDLGYTAEHDDKHDLYELLEFIQDRVDIFDDVSAVLAGAPDAEVARKKLIQIAALSAAAVRKIDREYGTGR